MKLLLILLISTLLPLTALADGESIVNINKNTGNITINFDNIPTEDRVGLLSKLISDDLERLADKHFYKNDYKNALTLYDSSIQINPNNISSKLRKFEARKKMISTLIEKKELYNSYLREAQNASTGIIFYKGKDNQLAVLLAQKASNLYPSNSKEYEKANLTMGQYMGVISRKVEGDSTRMASYEALKRSADEKLAESDYINAIYYYSILFSAYPKEHSLKRIAGLLNDIKT